MKFPTPDKILDFLFPQKCIFCEGDREGGGAFLCGLCQSDVVFITRPFCNRCGRPAEISYNYPHEKFECGLCRTMMLYFDQARSLGLYETVLRQLIVHFKYAKQPGIMKEIAPLLQAYFSEQKATGVVVAPIPLHVRRMKEREFDQAYLIARQVAEITGLPLAVDMLTREKETEVQASKSKRERLKNVRGAFRVNRPEEWKGKDILLVDDVFTTGATVNEAARVLKKAKVGRVCVFTLARA